MKLSYFRKGFLISFHQMGVGGGAEALLYLTCTKGFSIYFVNVLLDN